MRYIYKIKKHYQYKKQTKQRIKRILKTNTKSAVHFEGYSDSSEEEMGQQLKSDLEHGVTKFCKSQGLKDCNMYDFMKINENVIKKIVKCQSESRNRILQQDRIANKRRKEMNIDSTS